jgi:hypothetical protein
MIKLTRAPNLLIGQHWVNLLESAGIACRLHNRYLQGAMGDIPADQCGPEIWIEHEHQLATAAIIIDDKPARPAARLANWRCASCGESLEPQFTVCWQCGSNRLD